MAPIQPSTGLLRSRSRKTANEASARKSIADELNAYIAVRDNLLAKAEKGPTAAKLERAAIANEFVRNCLHVPRPAYLLQRFTENDALREHKRCELVCQRLDALRAKVA